MQAHRRPAASARAPVGAATGPTIGGRDRRHPPPPATAPGQRRADRTCPPRRRPRPRRPGRRRRALGLVLRLLAGRGGLGRGPGGEEGVPPGEDLRGRPHPPVGPPDRRHGDRGGPGRGPPLPGPAGPRLREGPRPGLARAPELPLLRLRDHPPRPRRRSSTSGPPRPGPPCGRGPRRSSPSWRRSRPGRCPWAAGIIGRRGRDRLLRPGGGSALRASGRWSRTRRAGRPGRSGPATWWWPTGPTPASAGPSARRGTGPAHGHGPARLLPLTRARPSRSSSPTSTSGTTDGKVVPGYGWIFPLGDGRVNVGVGLLSTDRRWKGVNTSTLMDALRGLGAQGVGALPGDLPRAADRGQAAHGAGRRPPGRRHHPGGGGRRRLDQPLQRRGHRLRLRDRAAGRGVAGRGPVWRRRGRPRPATRPGSRTPTGSTTGWPGPSSG